MHLPMRLLLILCLLMSINVISKKTSIDEKDDDYVQEYEYSYTYKSIIYEKAETNTPSNIYTNHAGNVVITGDTLGNILVSTNHGKSWAESKLLYDGNSYYSIAGLVMNEEGDKMLVSTNSNLIFYSSDYGSTFNVRSTERQCSIMAATMDLDNVVCIGGELTKSSTLSVDDDNDDGEDLYNYNYLYRSQDGGYTWEQSDSKHARWIGLLSNEDGSWIVGVIRHKLQYAWASDDGGKTYKCINDEEINDWGVVCGSKNLQTMMMTDTVSKNVHISVDYGYTWTQIYSGADLDDSISINSCAISANSYEGTETNINLALGFTGNAMKVVYGCDPHDEFEHCADRWYDTGNSDSDTYSQALSKNGKYFYSIDSSTMKIALGTRKDID